ncbi:MAG: hypothetical protein U5L04_02705 [Trueperaceae bacterium]|nr:hypothetical protein [Trueperaceae bacterium]
MSGKTTNDLERAERTAFHRRKILGEQTESSAGTGAVTLQPATDLNLGPNDVDQLDVEIHNAGTETVYLCRSGQTTGVPIAEGQTLREENVSADDGVFDLYGASAWGDVYVVWWTGDRS